MKTVSFKNGLPEQIVLVVNRTSLIPHSGFNSPTFYVEKIDKIVLDTPMLCVGEYVINNMKNLKCFTFNLLECSFTHYLQIYFDQSLFFGKTFSSSFWVGNPL